MKSLFTKILILTLFAFWNGEAASLIIQNKDVQSWLGAPLQYLDNRKSQFTAEDIQNQLPKFQNLDASVIDAGIWPFHVDYWFKLKLSAELPKDYVLQCKWCNPSRAYILSQGRLEEIEIDTSHHLAHANTIPLPQVDGYLLLHVKYAISMLPDLVSLRVLNRSSLTYESFMEHAFFGAIYGIILTMILYNASSCLTLRRSMLLVYIIYGLSVLFYIEGIWGYGSFLLGWKPMGSHWAYVGAIASGMAFFFFMYVFLNFKKYFPKISRAFLLGNSAIGISALILDQLNPGLSRYLYSILVIVLGFLMPLWGILASLKGYKPGLYFTVSASILSFGTSVYVIGLKGLYPFNFITENIQLACFVSEMALLSLGIGFQLRLEKDEVITHMEHSYVQLQKLVYPHQLTMIQQGLNLEKTLPVAEGHAVVIAFDVIQSTKIEHPNKRQLFQKIFQRCYAQMMKDYDNLNLSASAFRIKEMGDGFLCSVGFPFKTPFDEQAEEVAIQLAFNFLDIVREELLDFDCQQAIHVSIGVASGKIEGFFPKSGMRSYELFGEAIVLADRYEGLRKFILRESYQGHIITVQERVIRALPVSSSRKFKQYRLDPKGSIFVRDDPDAVCFYYYLEVDSEVMGDSTLNASA